MFRCFMSRVEMFVQGIIRFTQHLLYYIEGGRVTVSCDNNSDMLRYTHARKV